ncbi:pectin lyase-like protein [Xylariaceae sp. FL1651]|nr:pectin lyase-like protein [Xylariaceae sp. FL1651]
MKTSSVLLFTGGLLLKLASATDFYVSSQGSDQNAGTTEQAPFLTIEKAQQSVRSLISTSQSEDVHVHLASGIYNIQRPLNFTSADSGKNGFRVYWSGANATISGGIKVTNWTQGQNGIYSASVPVGSKSRNLYVDGKAANFARRKIQRNGLSYTATSIKWSSGDYDWLMSTAGLNGAEVRFISSFTDRYAPIDHVGSKELVMKQTAWSNQLIGYDTINHPNADFGVYVQNALALLTDAGQFYVDSAAGKVYYKPLSGENLATAATYLGIQEVLISVGGTYDSPAHDISFDGITFAHSTWLKPGQGYGYVDQQTGAYIGENTTYPEFEATRPHWQQMPSAVQVSAASNIVLANCTFTQLGGSGVGVGNDANAHLTKVGLGASRVSIVDNYFTQIMGNSLTVGGVQADSHHPSDTRMIISSLTITGNIFYNNSIFYSSCVPILVTYIQNSTIAHNDVSTTQYSGICHNYGWGSNDAGGSDEYQNRGLYKYQPRYTTPTTSKNNQIDGNLVHNYGLSHTDLGGIYTLSASPGTVILNNYVYDSSYYGLYTDEGSSQMLATNNVLMSNGPWLAQNFGAGNIHTGNNEFLDNWGKSGSALDGKPNHTGDAKNTYLRNYIASDVSKTSSAGQKAAYRAGVLPGRRAGRPVSNNPNLADAYLSIGMQGSNLAINVTNFDDLSLDNVSFKVTAQGATISAINTPSTVPGATSATATYNLNGANNPSVSASVTYTNSRTKQSRTLSVSGKPQG